MHLEFIVNEKSVLSPHQLLTCEEIAKDIYLQSAFFSIHFSDFRVQFDYISENFVLFIC